MATMEANNFFAQTLGNGNDVGAPVGLPNQQEEFDNGLLADIFSSFENNDGPTSTTTTNLNAHQMMNSMNSSTGAPQLPVQGQNIFDQFSGSMNAMNAFMQGGGGQHHHQQQQQQQQVQQQASTTSSANAQGNTMNWTNENSMAAIATAVAGGNDFYSGFSLPMLPPQMTNNAHQLFGGVQQGLKGGGVQQQHQHHQHQQQQQQQQPVSKVPDCRFNETQSLEKMAREFGNDGIDYLLAVLARQQQQQ